MYRQQPLQLGPVVTRTALGKDFRGLKYCWRCGYQKKLHIRAGLPYGDKCHGNCLRDECSKCGWRIEDCHENNLYGPFCTPQPTQKDCKHWYKKEPQQQTGII